MTFQPIIEKGFAKGNASNLPVLCTSAVLKFAAAIKEWKGFKDDDDLFVDYVQLIRTNTSDYVLVAYVFPNKDYHLSCNQAKTTVTLDSKAQEVLRIDCELCIRDVPPCKHIIFFLFWLNKRPKDNNQPYEFWGHMYERKSLSDQKTVHALRSYVKADTARLASDRVLNTVPRSEGHKFVDCILKMVNNIKGPRTALAEHYTPTESIVEKACIHHIMLNAVKLNLVSIQSIFEHLSSGEVGKIVREIPHLPNNIYKTRHWYELQYMRIRCSLVNEIAECATNQQKEEILERLMCKNRKPRRRERIALKEQKRFIVEQTEALEHKTYKRSRLLFNSAYPFMVASPDGIADDHVLEIKVAKNQQHFDSYLQKVGNSSKAGKGNESAEGGKDNESAEGGKDNESAEGGKDNESAEGGKDNESAEGGKDNKSIGSKDKDVGATTITPKYMAQMQIQIYMANRKKGLYCVLSPDFEKSGTIHYIWVDLDESYAESMLAGLRRFWRSIVCPRLLIMYKTQPNQERK